MTHFLEGKRISVDIKSVLLFLKKNWDSLHAGLNSHYEAWSYKKRSRKRLKYVGNMFSKNLQMKVV